MTFCPRHDYNLPYQLTDFLTEVTVNAPSLNTFKIWLNRFLHGCPNKFSHICFTPEQKRGTGKECTKRGLIRCRYPYIRYIGILSLIEVNRVQRSGIEAIRTQIKPSKPKLLSMYTSVQCKGTTCKNDYILVTT